MCFFRHTANPSNDAAAMILMITQDLMMSSAVSSVVKTMDEPLKTASSVAAAEKLIRSNQPRLLLVDLQTPSVKIAEIARMPSTSTRICSMRQVEPGSTRFSPEARCTTTLRA